MSDIKVEVVIQEAQSKVVQELTRLPARFFFHVTVTGPNPGKVPATSATFNGFTVQWWNKNSCWDRETKTLSLGRMNWFGVDISGIGTVPIDVDDILSIVPRADFRAAFIELAQNISAILEDSYPSDAIDLLEDMQPSRVVVAFELQEAHEQITQKTIEEPADIWFNIVGLDTSRLTKVARRPSGKVKHMTDPLNIVFDFGGQLPPTNLYADGLYMHAFGWLGAATTEKLRSRFTNYQIRAAFTDLAANIIRVARTMQHKSAKDASAKPPPSNPEVYVMTNETSVELVLKE